MYEIQVKVWDKNIQQPVWKSIHPSHDSTPYRYNTEEKARQSLKACYPDVNPEHLRVIESQKEQHEPAK